MSRLEYMTETSNIREFATDAVRYWERRRILYDAVLATIVLGYSAAHSAEAATAATLDRLLFLFVQAVFANVAYCAVYVPDIFAQSSEFRESWQRRRWILFVIGISVAGIITRAIVLSTLLGR